MEHTLWTRERLHELIETRLSGCKLIAVSNREPFIHRRDADGEIECARPASGMAAALHPIMAASGGVWIAHGGGDADRETVDEHDRVMVPPENPSYTLRRVWLTEEEENGYYYGLSNEGLWPLCHVTFNRPVFRPGDWETYRAVNRKFAEAVLEEAAGERSIVFIQDYHFCLLPRMLKQMGGDHLIVAQFWHIPWPNREVFRVFPWVEELLDGLLGNDLLGFHIRNHCQNFCETVDRVLESKIDHERSCITRNGQDTWVRPFPIGIDFAAHDEMAASPEVEAAMRKWEKLLNLRGRKLGAGIERLDYTKGIPARLEAIDYFFQQYPEWRGKVVFAQIAAPSRSTLPNYRMEEAAVDALAEKVNRRWGTPDWTPVVMRKAHHGLTDMIALHRLCDLFFVNSLHDGMNLVAKEFVASRFDERGMLLLSRFTGAARELPETVNFNPFAIHEIAACIHEALTMDEAEQHRRMKRMREQVRFNNIYRWAGKILSTLLKFDIPEFDHDADATELD